MKALYDKEDRDYYVFFEIGDIKKLLKEEHLTCLLYSRSPNDNQHIGYHRQVFEISVLETSLDVFRKNQELSKIASLPYGYTDVLVIYGDLKSETPCTLILSKDWIKEGLSEDLLNRCGKNEQRYGGNCKVHFYSEDSSHFTTTQMKVVFEMEEAVWQREYGHLQECSICEKPTTDNPFYAGDNPICSQKCLYEWDKDHPNLDT